MALTVLNVSFPLARVGPDAVGGAEQVLTTLDRGLVARGHTSLVVAPRGSVCAGELFATPAVPEKLDGAALERAEAAHREAIARALRAHSVDVVHLHGLDFDRTLPEPPIPLVATLHLPPGWYRPQAFRLHRTSTLLCCVSESQRALCPAAELPVDVVTNGVPLEDLHPGTRHGFAVALGRICPEKGLHLALEAAKRADVPLFLAGDAFGYEAHLRYFREEILPRLDAKRRFIGPLGARQKRRLLAGARCLLVPSRVAETSSLVAMEALACGTPVIAFRSGALVEIVEHGRTGLLVADVEEMAGALARADQLSRVDCRRSAVARFSAERMVDAYVSHYLRLAETARRGSRQLAIDEHHELDSLERLRPEWAQLADRAGANPFQRPEWLLPWCRHFGRCKPWTLAVRRAGELVGLCVLDVREDRVARPAGAGVSDRLDPLLLPEVEASAARALLARLAERRDAWDRLEWPALSPGSPVLREVVPAELEAAVEPGEVTTGMPLPRELERLRDVLPRKIVTNLRYYRRRAEQLGVSLERATPQTVDAHLDALFELHRARWRERGQPGVLAADHLERFHREVAHGFCTRGTLRMYALRVHERIGGIIYAFLEARRASFYLCGFDPELAALSPGTLLIGHAIEDAIRDGAREVDFLRGQERYKYAWGVSEQPSFTRNLWPAHIAQMPSAAT